MGHVYRSQKDAHEVVVKTELADQLRVTKKQQSSNKTVVTFSDD